MGKPEVPGLPSDALQLADQLRPVILRLYRQLRQETKVLGITSAQVALLAAIARSPGIGLSELAALQEMATPSLSGHIDRCEQAGLVERRRHEGGDRRRVGLTLTPPGHDLLAQVRAQRTAWLASRLAGIDEEARTAIAEALGPLSELSGHRL